MPMNWMFSVIMMFMMIVIVICVYGLININYLYFNLNSCKLFNNSSEEWFW